MVGGGMTALSATAVAGTGFLMVVDFILHPIKGIKFLIKTAIAGLAFTVKYPFESLRIITVNLFGTIWSLIVLILCIVRFFFNLSKRVRTRAIEKPLLIVPILAALLWWINPSVTTWVILLIFQISWIITPLTWLIKKAQAFMVFRLTPRLQEIVDYSHKRWQNSLYIVCWGLQMIILGFKKIPRVYEFFYGFFPWQMDFIMLQKWPGW